MAALCDFDPDPCTLPHCWSTSCVLGLLLVVAFLSFKIGVWKAPMARLKDPTLKPAPPANAEVAEDDLASSLAAELESNSCPICFELMKSPARQPMLLSPCGHTFCAKCLAVHTRGNAHKATCPYCRQKIVSQTLNLSLQKLIDNLTALQSKPSCIATHVLNRDGLSEKLARAQTRCNILRHELADTLEAKQDLERALREVDKRLDKLHEREAELKDMIQAIQLAHQGVQRELKDTGTSRSSIEKTQEEVTAKIDLIEATLLALEKDCHKFKLLLHDRDTF